MGILNRLGLRPEQRADKNGHVVTRYVKDGSQAANSNSKLKAVHNPVAADAHRSRVTADLNYRNHLDIAADTLKQLRADRQETIYTNTQTTETGEMIWNPDRRSQHREMVEQLMRKYENVKCEHKAVISGGLGGAGKSTSMRKVLGSDYEEQYAVVNPDDIKEEMARRGMIPEVEGLSPMEASPLVHEEASHVSKMFARAVRNRGMNVIYDVTMASGNSTKSKIEELKGSGYDVSGIFIDVDITTALDRSEKRHRRGWERYETGEGMGGRMLPRDIIEAQYDDSGEYRSINRGVFEQLKDKGVFAESYVYDNNVDGREPQLIA